MTLPFVNIKNKRQYTCFVCGLVFDTYDIYRNHIIDKHEEGREYILCPLSRCQAPVRDIPSHFKAKHPQEKYPKNGLLRVAVWKDFSKSSKSKTKAPRFRQGFLVSEKNNGAEIFYRSGYECDVYECLEALPSVLAYRAEPFKIPYFFKGKQRSYTPDLWIQFDDRVEIWEIKPINQKTLDINQAKWDTAAKYCEGHGWKFFVITETAIDKLKQRVKNDINSPHKLFE